MGAPLDSLLLVFFFASLVTYLHAILLGIPLAICLMRLHWLTLLRVLLAGALIGALPVSAWTIYNELRSDSASSSSFGGVEHRIDGRLTRAGWISTIEGVLMFGALGMLAGGVWWWLSGASACGAQGRRGHVLRGRRRRFQFFSYFCGRKDSGALVQPGRAATCAATLDAGVVTANNAMDSDTYSAPLRAPNSARHRGR